MWKPAMSMAIPQNHQTGNSISGSVDGVALKISGEVMVGAVIFLFMVLVFVVLLYLYAKRYWGATLGVDGAPRARLIFLNDTAPPRRRGLDETVLQSLPVTTFSSSDFKDGLECSVCLSDITDGEKTRLLPKCNHGFHLECIDMWFSSHSTCPLCRAAVVAEPVAVPDAVSAGAETEASPEEFPTNVLFWGTQDQVSTAAPPPPEEGAPSAPKRPEGALVIDIPRRAMDAFSSPVSPLTPSMAAVEDIKSPASDIKSPASARFKSLRRLLSYGKRAAGPSSSWTSPRAADVELGQGGLVLRPGGSATTPRTPPPTHS